MERVPVTSSNVSSIGYDPETMTLEVEFNDGSVYQYSGVPPQEYEGLLSASSKGSYMHSNIKGQYPHSRL